MSLSLSLSIHSQITRCQINFSPFLSNNFKPPPLSSTPFSLYSFPPLPHTVTTFTPPFLFSLPLQVANPLIIPPGVTIGFLLTSFSFSPFSPSNLSLWWRRWGWERERERKREKEVRIIRRRGWCQLYFLSIHIFVTKPLPFLYLSPSWRKGVKQKEERESREIRKGGEFMANWLTKQE